MLALRECSHPTFSDRAPAKMLSPYLNQRFPRLIQLSALSSVDEVYRTRLLESMPLLKHYELFLYAVQRPN